MKYVFFSLLSFICIFVNGQSIRFQLQRISPCESSPRIDSFDFYLTDNLSDSNYAPAYHKEIGVINLPRFGKYRLHTYDLEPRTNAEIEINDTGLHIYKIIEPKIILRTYNVLHPSSHYKICNKLAEGYQEDFYPNGNIRIRGTFTKGEAKDSLVEFFSNGATHFRSFYLPLNLYIQEYDSLSNLIKVSHNYHEHGYLTDYEKTLCFTNGNVKRIEVRSGHIITFKEYYLSGLLKSEQTKNYFKEYYENGKEKVICAWERKKYTDMDYANLITKIELNQSNDTIEKQVYQVFELNHPQVEYQPEIEILKSDWIIKWIKLENGQMITIAEDIDTEDYLKSHPNQNSR